jgi:hypothetical protein
MYILCKNTSAYYSASVEVVNAAVVRLVPFKIFEMGFKMILFDSHRPRTASTIEKTATPASTTTTTTAARSQGCPTPTALVRSPGTTSTRSC